MIGMLKCGSKGNAALGQITISFPSLESFFLQKINTSFTFLTCSKTQTQNIKSMSSGIKFEEYSSETAKRKFLIRANLNLSKLENALRLGSIPKNFFFYIFAIGQLVAGSFRSPIQELFEYSQ